MLNGGKLGMGGGDYHAARDAAVWSIMHFSRRGDV